MDSAEHGFGIEDVSKRMKIDETNKSSSTDMPINIPQTKLDPKDLLCEECAPSSSSHDNNVGSASSGVTHPQPKQHPHRHWVWLWLQPAKSGTNLDKKICFKD